MTVSKHIKQAIELSKARMGLIKAMMDKESRKVVIVKGGLFTKDVYIQGTPPSENLFELYTSEVAYKVRLEVQLEDLE